MSIYNTNREPSTEVPEKEVVETKKTEKVEEVKEVKELKKAPKRTIASGTAKVW